MDDEHREEERLLARFEVATMPRVLLMGSRVVRNVWLKTPRNLQMGRAPTRCSCPELQLNSGYGGVRFPIWSSSCRNYWNSGRRSACEAR